MATLEAGRVAREAGAAVVGITAKRESELACEGPCLIASPDLSTTDPVDQVALMLGNFSFSLAALYVMAIHLGERLGRLQAGEAEARAAEIGALPAAIERAMGCSSTIENYLGTVDDEADFYFVGAGPSTGVALFYQAKFFEQAQRPVYAAELEEFTHEQFFLLRPSRDAEVWFIAPQSRSTERAREVMAACRELGARVVAVTSRDGDAAQKVTDLTLPIAPVSEMFSPLVSTVPGGLLGIHAFGRWGSGPLSTSERHQQMAIGRKLTRGERKE